MIVSFHENRCCEGRGLLYLGVYMYFCLCFPHWCPLRVSFGIKALKTLLLSVCGFQNKKIDLGKAVLFSQCRTVEPVAFTVTERVGTICVLLLSGVIATPVAVSVLLLVSLMDCRVHRTSATATWCRRADLTAVLSDGPIMLCG